MNILRSYKILLLLCMAFALHGCKKLIEINAPVNIVVTEQVFKTNEQANSAMAGIFSRMMTNSGAMTFSNGGLTVYAGLSADELRNLTSTQNALDYQFYTNKLDFTNGTPSGMIWQPAYKLIYDANAVIEGIAASTSTLLNDSTRKVLTGEALFVRAFCYFYLTNMFGDVPLVLTSDFRQTASMKKTPQAEVFSQIVKDLKDAQAKLTADYSTVAAGERVRPNKWAATALLARTQLYLKNWEDAEAQASVVIGNSLYSLPANLNSVFLKNSREAIWQMKQNPLAMPINATWEGFSMLPMVRWSDFSADEQAFLSDPTFFSEFAPAIIPTFYLTPQAVQVFETGDKRRSQWIDSTPTPSAPPFNGVPYRYPRKYTIYLGLATDPVPQYYTVLRLAEQHLIRAEARAQLNNTTGAAADIDILRTRAGVPKTTAASQETLLTAVMKERQRELFAEWGHRWLDLKRTNQANTVLGSIPYKQPWQSYQLLYPIPPDEISANPHLIQNPEY